MTAENYVSKSLDNIQTKNQRIFVWDKPLCTNAKLHHWLLDSHDGFVGESRLAQAHLAGPVQVKFYKVIIQRRGRNPRIYKFTIFYE
jgi:hypothetical protein